MNGSDHKACYGEMFPDLLHLGTEGKAAGKVFSFVIVSPPGLMRPPRHVAVNRQEWDQCLACPEFDSCYKLSMARLALEAAVANI
jgi:hypothetical protein